MDHLLRKPHAQKPNMVPAVQRSARGQVGRRTRTPFQEISTTTNAPPSKMDPADLTPGPAAAAPGPSAETGAGTQGYQPIGGHQAWRRAKPARAWREPGAPSAGPVIRSSRIVDCHAGARRHRAAVRKRFTDWIRQSALNPKGCMC